MTAALTVQPDRYGLLTDLYELTMGACYAGEGIAETPASFELFVRRLPDGCGYAIAAGLEQALDYLRHLRFTAEQIAELRTLPVFARAPEAFWELLPRGFAGDVWALPEGTAVFPDEPLLRVDAPLWQAQLAETYLLNALNYQTAIATRAARMRDLAGDEATLLEFGTRRAFSPQGALWAARAAIAAGFDATSNVLAALQLGRAPSGTMAHSLVMAFAALEGSEDEAFAAFQRYFPDAPLLIDTFDTLAAAERLAAAVRAGTARVGGVRVDSGNLAALSQAVRDLLPEVPIFASGNIDEYEIGRLRAESACIDGYGVGTQLVTGQPFDGVYKLVEIAGIPTAKQSSSKATLPGRKQVFRSDSGDRLALADEAPQPGERALLVPVMRGGALLGPTESLDAIAARTRASVTNLPARYRQLDSPPPYPVAPSAALERLAAEVKDRLAPSAIAG